MDWLIQTGNWLMEHFGAFLNQFFWSVVIIVTTFGTLHLHERWVDRK